MIATTTTTAIVIIIIAIAYLERVVGVYVLARIYGHMTVAASGFSRGVYPPGRAVKRQARSGNLIKSTKPLWL